MKIVVDTNILFSSLLSKSTSLRAVLLDSREHVFYSPNITYVELFKYKEKIIRYSKLSEEEVLTDLEHLINKINFVNREVISTASYQKAYEYCKDTDVKDTPFVALAIEFGAKYWTGDLKIKEAIRKKGFNELFKS